MLITIEQKELKDVQKMYGSACLEIDKLKKVIESKDKLINFDANLINSNINKIFKLKKEVKKLKERIFNIYNKGLGE